MYSLDFTNNFNYVMLQQVIIFENLQQEQNSVTMYYNHLKALLYELAYFYSSLLFSGALKCFTELL